MHPHRPAVFLAALIVATLLAHAASAQVSDRMKATAPEKMMPSEKVKKMRECQERAKQQKIKWRTAPASWTSALQPKQNNFRT
jgi:hypothetical protein